MKKRLLGILLVVCLMFVEIPVAFANAFSNGCIIHDGKEEYYLALSTPDAGEGWTWDGKGTITLNGFHGLGILMANPENKIVLADGSVNTIYVNTDDYLSYMPMDGHVALCAMSPNFFDDEDEVPEGDMPGDLTIEGNGSLAVKGSIEVEDSNLIINGGTLTLEGAAIAHKNTDGTLDIYEDILLYVEDLTVNGGSISATSRIIVGPSGGFYNEPAIYVKENFDMAGGNVQVKVVSDEKEQDSKHYQGIWVRGNFIITNGQLKLEGCYSDNKYGTAELFSCDGVSNIQGGEITTDRGFFWSKSITLGTGVTAAGGSSSGQADTLNVMTHRSGRQTFANADNSPASNIRAVGTNAPPAANNDISSWAVDQVNQAIAAGLVPSSLQSGYTQNATRAEFCALAAKLYETVKGAEIAQRKTFTDTQDGNVEKMAALGVVNGVGEGQFNPGGAVTREAAATMLARLANAIGKPLTAAAPSFADSGSISDWAKDAVGQVQASGIMNGVGDNQFAPSLPYTREQSILTMLRLYNLVK